MKEETKNKLKKAGKIACGIGVGALALLGVISLGGMVKSCSKDEITPVVTTPVVTSMAKKAKSKETNITHSSRFGAVNTWAELQTSQHLDKTPTKLETDFAVDAFVFGENGNYWEISEIELYAETGTDYNTYIYSTGYGAIASYTVDLHFNEITESSVYGTLWTLPQYADGNFIGENLDFVEDMIANGLLEKASAIGEIENPVFPPHAIWPLNYANVGGYWVDNVTGGVVSQMQNGLTYDLVWVSVQGYLYPTDIQAEEHTSTDGGAGIFSTKDGRVHMEFTATDPVLTDRITIATNLSSLAIPGGSTSGDNQVNTATGLSNSFALLGSAFASMAGLLSMEVFPGLSLSALLFVPVVVAVILFIIKAIQK